MFRAIVGAAERTPKLRRTQEERRAQTRGKLLDATIESLHEVGYAATTTRRVTERAGVSQGAQTHYFPYRVDLVGAAVERLAERRIATLTEQAAALPQADPERARVLLDLLWNDFSGELFTTFVKLWIAAADDAELYERLVPLERTMAREIARAIPDVLGETPAPADFPARLATVLAAMRGLALTQAYEPRARRGADPWPTIRPLLEQILIA